MPRPIMTDIAGTVFKILKAPGDGVAAGETVIIVEAMKMEIAIASEEDGRIASIDVAPDDMIEEDQVIATLEDAR